MEMVEQFVNGEIKEDSNEPSKFSIAGNSLFYEGELICIKNIKEFHIADANLSQDISDALIFSIAKFGGTFERKNLKDLFETDIVLGFIDNCEIDKLKEMLLFHNILLDDEHAEAIRAAHQFRSKIKETFEDLADKQRDVRSKYYSYEADELLDAWDRCELPASTRSVHGAGNKGIRIRLKTTPSGKQFVETNHGYRTTLKSAKTAWDKACDNWNNPILLNRQSRVYVNISSSRAATITESSIIIGCQVITKEEATRFAGIMGW